MLGFIGVVSKNEQAFHIVTLGSRKCDRHCFSDIICKAQLINLRKKSK